MKRRTFYPAHLKGRAIEVSIDTDYITFSYTNVGSSEFYSIPCVDWVKDKTSNLDFESNWHRHTA